MKKFIAFLRGINVGGHNKIKMEELRKSFESLSLKNIKTFIQSGNVIFDSPGNAGELVSLIEGRIKKDYGFDITVILRTPAELKKIVDAAPYIREMMKEPKLLYVMLLSGKPKPSDVNQVDAAKYLPDQFFLLGKELYLYLPNGAGRTKISNNFFESKLKVTGTSRNWNTLNELIMLTE